jgi:hypothetical protein
MGLTMLIQVFGPGLPPWLQRWKSALALRVPIRFEETAMRNEIPMVSLLFGMASLTELGEKLS